LCADKLFIAANKIIGKKDITFSIVRYGNVLGSRGSVLPNFLNQNKNTNNFTVTDKKMTRFNITINDAIETVIWSLKNSLGGEIVVPKLSSYNILNFAKAINENKKIIFTGTRPGEKIHEEMIAFNESMHAIELKKYYLILPYEKKRFIKKYKKKIDSLNHRKPFSYNSYENTYLSIKDLKKIIKNQIDNNFVEF